MPSAILRASGSCHLRQAPWRSRLWPSWKRRPWATDATLLVSSVELHGCRHFMYFDTTLRHVLSWSEDYTFIGILVLSCYWWLRVANLSHAARALNQHWLFNLSWPWVHTQKHSVPKTNATHTKLCSSFRAPTPRKLKPRSAELTDCKLARVLRALAWSPHHVCLRCRPSGSSPLRFQPLEIQTGEQHSGTKRRGGHATTK